MAKLPAFQFYPGDWLKDPNLRRCTHASKGVWMDLLCLMFESEERGVLATAGRAWSDEEIALAVGGDQAVVLACVQELTLKGVANRQSNGALYSKRLVRDEHKRKLCTEAGKRGGNPQLGQTLKGSSKGLLKGDAKGGSKRNPTPSSSTSSSTSVDIPLPLHGDAEDKPLCTIEQARAYAPMARMKPEAVEFWWHTRNSAGWRKGGAGSARITSWQSDMSTSAQWAAEGAAKSPPESGSGWSPRFPGEKRPA